MLQLILFLIFAALAFVATILFRIVMAAVRMRRKFKQAMGGSRSGKGAMGAQPGASEEQRQKVYPKNVGEYVSFEEIAVEDVKMDSGGGYEAKSEVRVEVEPQISDVEFEEIK